jgi:hypothetical protein
MLACRGEVSIGGSGGGGGGMVGCERETVTRMD